MPRKHKKLSHRNLYRKDVELPRGPRGERRRTPVFGKTVAEVDRKAVALRNQIATGTLVEPSAVRFGAFILDWLETQARSQIESSTYDSYLSVIRCHVAPRIGNVRLSKLSPIHVVRMLGEMEADGLSSSKRKHAYTVINRACKVATAWRLMLRNPCDDVPTPKVSRAEMQVLNKDQAQTFLSEVESDRLHALYVLAVTRGIRQGELFALKHDDVDLENRRISIKRTLKDNRGKLMIGPPKTAASRRRIAIPQMAADALHEHKKQLLREGLAGCEWVFPNFEGGWLRRQNVQRRSFKPLLERCGLPALRFHDLRHTAATLLLLANEHPKIVSEMLGHSRVSVTLDLYSHVLPSMQEQSADKMDAMFSVA